MNQITVFSFDEQQVRTIINDGQAWFVARDVCGVLDISNNRDALSRLDQDERDVVLTDTPGGKQPLSVVNEYGLYNLVLGSRKPEAKAFKRWITHEVIPSIRKTGSYSFQQTQSIEDLIIMQATAMKEAREKAEKAHTLAETAHHRIDSLDAVNVIGDLQQRLNAMVRKYAQREGVTFSKAWKDFTASYNNAFHTNLTALVDNYKEKHGLRDLTRPQYLSLIGGLEDAIRVADKMLNPVEV